MTPHAPDTCSRALLPEIERVATPRGIRVATHLSQSRLENRRIQEREGCTPTELLETVGLLNDRLIAAHGIYMSDADIARGGHAHIHLAHVPKGNADRRSHRADPPLARARVSLALATDNMHADMVEVMRWALCIGRVQAERIDEDWQPDRRPPHGDARGRPGHGDCRTRSARSQLARRRTWWRSTTPTSPDATRPTRWGTSCTRPRDGTSTW